MQPDAPAPGTASATETSPRDELIRRGLRFSQLRLLAALEDTGQISAAAAQIAITQPAASRLLAELERTVEARIYERHSRGVVLTEAGQFLCRRARAILSQLDETRAEMDQMIRGERGHVGIGTVTGPSLELVLPVLRELRVAYPEIEAAVQVDTSDKLAEALLSKEVDFYIGRLPGGMDPRVMTLRPIGPEPLGLIVRAGHPLLRRPEVSLSDCLEFDWVMQPPGQLLRRTAETYLLEKGLQPPARVLSTSSLLLTLALISETNAVAPVAQSVARFYAGNGGGIRQLDTAHDMAVAPFSVIQRRGADPSPAVRRVLSLLYAKI